MDFGSSIGRHIMFSLNLIECRCWRYGASSVSTPISSGSNISGKSGVQPNLVSVDLPSWWRLMRRLYQVFYGLMVCPWYAYSQTMISEVSPLPQMYVFVAWFNVLRIRYGVPDHRYLGSYFLLCSPSYVKLFFPSIAGCKRLTWYCFLEQIGKTSAFIGPFVSEAIITASGNNNNMPFAFLFALYVTIGFFSSPTESFILK